MIIVIDSVFTLLPRHIDALLTFIIFNFQPSIDGTAALHLDVATKRQIFQLNFVHTNTTNFRTDEH